MATQVVDIFATPDYAKEVDRAAALLREGGVVVVPTETIYGAAGALTQQKSLQRLKELRGGEAKPFTIHLAACQEAEKFLAPVNDYARRLMSKLWPGPVGLMFDVPADRRTAVSRELGVPESEIYHGSKIGRASCRERG